MRYAGATFFGNLAPLIDVHAGEATQPGSGAMLLTDAFIGFALGLLSATRAELYLRGRQLLSAA